MESGHETRILAIEDEPAIRDLLCTNLKTFRVATADCAASGLKQVNEFHPHVILLDLSLPDRNGLDLLKELRRWTHVPVIILTVSDDEETKVRLLDAGADDYLTKPFGLNELLARIRVSLRTHGRIEATPILQAGDLEVDLNQRTVKRDQQLIKLTQTEFEVLAMLVRDFGKVVPQSQILKRVWGITAADQNHYLRIYINQLRKKVEREPSNPKHIVTEPGVGYRLI